MVCATLLMLLFTHVTLSSCYLCCIACVIHVTIIIIIVVVALFIIISIMQSWINITLTLCLYYLCFLFQELYGWTMDEIVKQIGLKNNCKSV